MKQMVSDSEKELISALKQVMKMHGIELDEELLTKDEHGEFVDYSEVISKTQSKIDELNQRAEEIYKKTGMSREELLEYSSNRSNFSQEEWESLERVRHACDQVKQESLQLLEKPEQEMLRHRPKSGKKQGKKFAKRKDWLSG